MLQNNAAVLPPALLTAQSQYRHQFRDELAK